MADGRAPIDLDDWRIIKAGKWDWHDQNLVVRPYVDALVVEVERLRADEKILKSEVHRLDCKDDLLRSEGIKWKQRAEAAEAEIARFRKELAEIVADIKDGVYGNCDWDKFTLGELITDLQALLTVLSSVPPRSNPT